MKISIVALITLTLTGCATWPPYQESALPLNPNLELLQIRLDILALKGGKACIPAHLYKNQILAGRIKDEISAGLHDDAQNDLLILSKNIHHMENRLQYITQHTKCTEDIKYSAQPSQKQPKLKKLKEWAQDLRNTPAKSQ